MSDDATPPVTGNDDGNGTAAAGNGSTPKPGAGQSIDAFPPDAQDYIKRLREENAAKRNEAKELKTQLEARENEGKSEQERKEQALAESQRTASESTAKLLRYEVAADKGLPLKYAARLQGSTKEELEKDADGLMKDFGLDGDGSTPAPGFDGGVRRPVTRPASMNDLIRSAAGRR